MQNSQPLSPVFFANSRELFDSRFVENNSNNFTSFHFRFSEWLSCILYQKSKSQILSSLLHLEHFRADTVLCTHVRNDFFNLGSQLSHDSTEIAFICRWNILFLRCVMAQIFFRNKTYSVRRVSNTVNHGA